MDVFVYSIVCFHAINRILSLEEYKQQILQQFVFDLCSITANLPTYSKSYDVTKCVVA